jgi:hypothetical protein
MSVKRRSPAVIPQRAAPSDGVIRAPGRSQTAIAPNTARSVSA